ncbi:uncharacterized protein LOC119766023 [Culex quinquefasciatus]|uniref:uncharacterized protein LOC119766023 n=1 Tax=Culex quinquefasciatus TaxID=7176 RepID=UPI0018E3A48F|nr:uncharacterized protein LOC119766023 [Culex quinquefasciatus]
MTLPRTPKSGKKKKKKNTPKKKPEVPEEEHESGDDTEKEVTPVKKQLEEQRRKQKIREMEEQLNALVRQREAMESKLKRLQTALKTSVAAPNPNLRNGHFLKQQLSNARDCFSKFGEYQGQIHAMPLNADQRTHHERIELNFETLYDKVCIDLNEYLERLEKPGVAALVPAAPTNVGVQQVLPPLSVPLPKFDGTFETWYSFKSMFQNIMARYTNEAPSIKLYHLRDALIGRAAGVIDQEMVNNNDYDAAWALLEELYEDRRAIIERHIENIFAMPKITRDNTAELRKVIDVCVKNIEALKKLNLPANGLGEQMVVNLLVSRMDKDMRRAWEANQKAGELPTYEATIVFLKEKRRIADKLEQNSESEKVKPQRSVTKTKTLVVASEGKCSVCNQDHEVIKGEQFKQKSVNERYIHLRKHGLCFNCLRKGHRTDGCTSTNSCQKCSKRHHTLLHTDGPKKQEPAANTASTVSAEGRTQSVPPATAGSSQAGQGLTLCTTSEAPRKQTLLSTAVVLVYGAGSVPYLCRALIDSCSQNHFVTERFANLLASKKERADYRVSGLNGGTTRISHLVRAKVKSRVGNFAADLELLVAPKITGDVPVKTIDIDGWNLPPDVELADPNFNQRGRVDMLLGAGIFWDLMKAKRITLAANLPSLRDTELGWVVGGVMSEGTPVIARTFCTMNEDEELNKLLNRFWEIEGVEDLRRPVTSTAEECLEHFRSTYSRKPDGRIVVRLPFNERKSDLGVSREMAIRRFLNLERRLDQQPDLKQEYAKFIHEYEQLGHMKEVDVGPSEPPGSAYYLPHHCVLRPSSTTTKLRVVFDGSAKTSTGVSINDALKVGPTVQNDLLSILLNFRCYRYVFTTDIPKMFRQIELHPEDTPYQRILWRDDRSQLLKVFELKTVTYGLASSPFHATMALNQIAEDGEKEFPLASAALKKSFYVDDGLCGAQSVEEARLLSRDLRKLLNTGGFDAHKWCANDPAILEEVPESLWGTTFDLKDAAAKSVVKTLGVAWNASQDWFTFTVLPPRREKPLTRQKVLSEIAKFFDPLGLAGPVVTTAKLILRKVGTLKNIGWLDPVPDSVANEWRRFREQLPALNDFRVSRWVYDERAERVELHGYSDASDDAYGASVYARNIYPDGEITMRLICSKSKLLPKKVKNVPKEISTPKGELEGALLLAELVDKLVNVVDVCFDSVNFWCDSQVVLSWIAKKPEDLELFMANRVRKIQQLTSKYRWGYIPTDDNPADLISRGVMPQNLIQRVNWKDGPVSMNNRTIEVVQPPLLDGADLPGLRSTKCLALAAPIQRLRIFDKLGDFRRLLRSMSIVVRFANYIISRRKVVVKGLPTSEERAAAQKLILRLVQREAFQTELLALKENHSHRLRGLNPFIDPDDGLLRVGGRIKQAFVPYDSRHQILMPAKHPVTESFIRYEHVKNLHVGQKGLLALIRQRFWPMNVKTTIRKVIRGCVTCFRVNPMKTAQLMGDLPSYRVQPAPAFFHTGVDFAGPFLIKSLTAARRPMMTKGYVSLFVCMSTRAIHLELVSSLTTDAFLAALRRFTGRRGLVNKMHSDNATNFVGSETELERLAKLFAEEQHIERVEEFCSSHGITWSFIPPRSPHFGGIWEAGVKSVKHHLKRVVGNQKLTFEELTTVLVQIEAVLNSRPLTPCSDDPNDLTAVTPAHFLIGREMRAVPEPSYLHLKQSTLSRWQHVQAMQQQFWKRWIAEYLPELQNRQKWFKTTKIQPGALVLISDPNAPPMQWQLGRIIALHPGKDDVTRVVTLRTAKGECKRGVTEICLLPLDQETTEED